MITLETTRVCIIDDEPKEYLPLIHALSRLRMGCIHIAGDKVEDLPPIDEPLKGLRLVFLDMQLGSEGGDYAAITAHTAQVFSRVVSPNAGPLLVIVWTKHDYMVEMFQKRLYDHYPNYLGKLLFTKLEKPADEADPNKLRVEIQKKCRNSSPLKYFGDGNSWCTMPQVQQQKKLVSTPVHVLQLLVSIQKRNVQQSFNKAYLIFCGS
jgi:hypothetical protein